MIGDLRVQETPEDHLVEIGVVRARAAGRKRHHRNGDLVVKPRVGDAPAAVLQVFDIVEGVEVADRGDPVFREEVRVELDDLPRLRIEGYNVDAPGEGLKVRVRAGSLAETVHHLERVLIAVEVE